MRPLEITLPRDPGGQNIGTRFSASGHSRPGRVSNKRGPVRYCPDSDQILQRREMTRRAITGSG
jgi:hypothetical protein